MAYGYYDKGDRVRRLCDGAVGFVVSHPSSSGDLTVRFEGMFLPVQIRRSAVEPLDTPKDS